MLQKLVLILSFVILGFHSNAQNAVTWSTTKEKVEKEDNTYLIIFHANIATIGIYILKIYPAQMLAHFLPNLHLMSTKTLTHRKSYGRQSKMHSVMDEAFGVQVNYYDGASYLYPKSKD